VLPGEALAAAWRTRCGGVPVEFDTSNPAQDLREHGTTAEGRPAMSGQQGSQTKRVALPLLF